VFEQSVQIENTKLYSNSYSFTRTKTQKYKVSKNADAGKITYFLMLLYILDLFQFFVTWDSFVSLFIYRKVLYNLWFTQGSSGYFLWNG
jgi:hypothetical protein